VQKPKPIQELLRGGEKAIDKNGFDRRGNKTKAGRKREGDVGYRQGVSSVSRGGIK